MTVKAAIKPPEHFHYGYQTLTRKLLPEQLIAAKWLIAPRPLHETSTISITENL